ncbi:hypothetical protein FFRU_050900 [Fructobacillus fructosus]|uniref:Uncharacterized protein n=1 Tax=Fructobacillus fructosus TaxID=1631 RepID=A0ABN9YSM3_9LACO|nr:hypothetical protein [Fructobacillus fructosus]CAK1224163.1 hypothetical protein LMG30235_GOPAMIKF_00122 [Fructobacillus fructosus]CAK1224291.1 hypothetical protein LMG30234_GAICNKDF_00122 [Fructobacillus fructosus]CAK1224474.1 hypothetical protein R54866_LGPIEIPA_00123 [Fructobacillus fructosus]CAK1242673.1 hypothetical protein R54839_PPFHFPJH_00967 [Fructobacillus fructosus]GAP01274.1 hypothetical protein FFRU_050900 [Fructobacillus fructosus]
MISSEKNFAWYKSLISKNMSYMEAVHSLKKRYSAVGKPYFYKENFENVVKGDDVKLRKRRKNSKKGLYIHHILEKEFSNLSSKSGIKNNKIVFESKKEELFSNQVEYFVTQIPDNLVFCDVLEHMILHAKSSYEFNGQGKEGYLALRGKCKKWFPIAQEDLVEYGDSFSEKNHYNEIKISRKNIQELIRECDLMMGDSNEN